MSERIRRARGPQQGVPCHNDLLNANFLDDGAIRIVDWEYAGMGDRFFDLANLSVNHEFGAAEDEVLLDAYFDDASEERLASLAMMKFMSDFREAMWGVLQSGISELDFDFKDYATKHFARLNFEPAGA
jgi:thiamine kinase-like enzyme